MNGPTAQPTNADVVLLLLREFKGELLQCRRCIYASAFLVGVAFIYLMIKGTADAKAIVSCLGTGGAIFQSVKAQQRFMLDMTKIAMARSRK